jgi:hypothetical protein
MNEEDLRDCFAMFASTRIAYPDECYKFADAMLQARKYKEKSDEEDSGIAAVVPKRPRKR